MKKSLLFVVIFSMAFLVLQILSGMVLTLLYTPNVAFEGVVGLSSQVDFGNTIVIPPLIISLGALGISFGVIKMIGKKLAF